MDVKNASRDSILESKTHKTEQIDVPEWGGVVFVRTMSGEERDDFEASLVDAAGPDQKKNFRNLRARLLVKTIVDENGNRLFSDADAVPLGRQSAVILDRVFSISQRLNSLGQQDIEKLTKNS